MQMQAHPQTKPLYPQEQTFYTRTCVCVLARAHSSMLDFAGALMSLISLAGATSSTCAQMSTRTCAHSQKCTRAHTHTYTHARSTTWSRPTGSLCSQRQPCWRELTRAERGIRTGPSSCLCCCCCCCWCWCSEGMPSCVSCAAAAEAAGPPSACGCWDALADGRALIARGLE